MAYRVTTLPVQAGGQSSTAFVLSDAENTVRLEVWPAFGFNALRWQTRDDNGQWANLLYCDPNWEANPVATRSGHPILFPFPNRLALGRFTFEGREYQLPLNESSGTHAIHGFTPKTPWRVLGSSTGHDHAEITGQFQLSVDRPDALACWPSDARITLSYRLFASSLEVNAYIENPGTAPMPFGLGYHPYFCLPTSPNATVDALQLQLKARQFWPVEAGIPTGERTAIPVELDFNTWRAIRETRLDTLYTGLPLGPAQKLRELARLTDGQTTVAVKASADFREALLFTPLHRHAVAIEPYTCASNAANLPDGGWRVLAPGQSHANSVRYEWAANLPAS